MLVITVSFQIQDVVEVDALVAVVGPESEVTPNVAIRVD